MPPAQLGKGSFGVVNAAVRKSDRRPVVLKVVRMSGMSKREQEEAYNEVRVLASLSSPYVTRYFDSFMEDTKLHIVMEFCTMGTLHGYLKGRKGMLVPEDDVWRILIQARVPPMQPPPAFLHAKLFIPAKATATRHKFSMTLRFAISRRRRPRGGAPGDDGPGSHPRPQSAPPRREDGKYLPD